MIAEANVLVKQYRTSEAIERWTQALDLSKEGRRRFLITSNRSMCYLRVEDYDLAMKDARSVQEMRPDLPDVSIHITFSILYLHTFDASDLATGLFLF